MTQTEVVVIGAGPAGIAAATATAEHGREVIVLDDNPVAGGQIWRESVAGQEEEDRRDEAPKRRALARLAGSGARVLSGHRVFDAAAPVEPNGLGVVHALRQDGATAVQIAFRQAILATGARERFLPFPGWTLPGVFGAGGLQALVKSGFPVEGKRVLVAGTGPLLLAVAAHLRHYGATVVAVVEQAPMARLARFGASLWLQPEKLLQGLGYRRALRQVPYRTGCWPVAAFGSASLQGVTLTDGRRTWQQPCELLACGFHLVPNTELPALLGCTLSAGFVQVDAQQRTSLPGIFSVGEPTGIAGLRAALLQGEIAGRACAGAPTTALEKRAAGERAFAGRLAKTFALRRELFTLAAPDTIVCRCEDVRWGRLTGYTGCTDAKLQTRCGMGPCQGRVCGPAVEALLGWLPSSVRQPLFPVPLSALCPHDEQVQTTQGVTA